MMIGCDATVGLMVGAAVGTLFLVPAHGLAQRGVIERDPCSSGVVYMSPLDGLIRCAEDGNTLDQHTLGLI